MTTWTKEQIETEVKAGSRSIVLRTTQGVYRDLNRTMLAKMEPGTYQVRESRYEVVVFDKPTLRRHAV